MVDDGMWGDDRRLPVVHLVLDDWRLRAHHLRRPFRPVLLLVGRLLMRWRLAPHLDNSSRLATHHRNAVSYVAVVRLSSVVRRGAHWDGMSSIMTPVALDVLLLGAHVRGRNGIIA